jgi:hypothetical protein
VEQLYRKRTKQSAENNDAVGVTGEETIRSVERRAPCSIEVGLLVPGSHKATRILEIRPKGKRRLAQMQDEQQSKSPLRAILAGVL